MNLNRDRDTLTRLRAGVSRTLAAKRALVTVCLRLDAGSAGDIAQTQQCGSGTVDFRSGRCVLGAPFNVVLDGPETTHLDTPGDTYSPRHQGWAMMHPCWALEALFSATSPVKATERGWLDVGIDRTAFVRSTEGGIAQSWTDITASARLDQQGVCRAVTIRLAAEGTSFWQEFSYTFDQVDLS